LALGAAALAWLAGFAWFAVSVPGRVAEPDRRTDAIVVLTGGSRRLEEGLMLLQRRLADRLFVSGVHRAVDMNELLRGANLSPTELSCCVVLGHAAADTAGNAVESARWMRQNGFGSLRLVTASYHMPRSLLEFRHAMKDKDIVPHPVFPEGFQAAGWWRRPAALEILLGEYTKYLAAAGRIALGLRAPGTAEAP
jgi:uncharacterized SAM-binding protein YcdF (DUF218 family)